MICRTEISNHERYNVIVSNITIIIRLFLSFGSCFQNPLGSKTLTLNGHDASEATHTYTLVHPIPSEMLAFELNADDTLFYERSHSFLGGHSVRDLRQECEIWTRLTTEHFSFLKQSILNEPWPTGHDGASGPCSHMGSFLHDIALVGICKWHGRCVYRQWFLEVFLGPFIIVNDRIMPMSDTVLSEGPKTFDVMHCRLWNLQSLCNLTLRIVAFKVFHSLFFTLFHRLESLCSSLFLRDSASFL